MTWEYILFSSGVINIENTWVSLDSEQNKDEDLLNKVNYIIGTIASPDKRTICLLSKLIN